ncbi:ABC transporter ATP-binding protein [Zymomonas mobilis]|uniref:ABC transporter ATP-binding protein n=1 Tax=Zymomonas mobilis TaxID=542 RepID=UPI0039ECCADE
MRGFEVVTRLVALLPIVKSKIRLGMILGIMAGFSTVIGLSLSAYAVSQLCEPITKNFWMYLAGGLAGLSGGFGLRSMADLTTHEASYRLEVKIRENIADRLASLPLGDIYQLGAGRIKKIMHNDVKGLHAAVADASPFVGVGFSQPLAALLVLLIIQWKMFLVVSLMLPVIGLCMYFMTRDFAEQQKRYNNASEAVNTAVIEFVQGMPVIRTFDGDRLALKRFKGIIDTFTRTVSVWLAFSRQSSKLNNIFITPLPTLLLISACGIFMLQCHWISFSNFLLAMMIGSLPVQAVMPLMYLSQMLSEAKAAASRICELLDMKPLPEPAHPQIPHQFDITFDHVRFSYNNDTRKPALDDISFVVPEKTVCALVGASGSGKSTVARLIPRFWDVTNGSIRLGNIDIRDINSQVLLQHIAFVFQEPFLVSGSVAENIALADPNASDEQIKKAAQMAQAEDFILNLEEGYQTQVGDGGNRLSGGQRQRITIARALLSKASIVILDEPTAWVDPESEAKIQMALKTLSQHKTVIVIAHRLATIMDADQILVMEKGHIVEGGRHAELLQKQGKYAEIWQHYQESSHWHLDKGKKDSGGLS